MREKIITRALNNKFKQHIEKSIFRHFTFMGAEDFAIVKQNFTRYSLQPAQTSFTFDDAEDYAIDAIRRKCVHILKILLYRHM